MRGIDEWLRCEPMRARRTVQDTLLDELLRLRPALQRMVELILLAGSASTVCYIVVTTHLELRALQLLLRGLQRRRHTGIYRIVSRLANSPMYRSRRTLQDVTVDEILLIRTAAQLALELVLRLGRGVRFLVDGACSKLATTQASAARRRTHSCRVGARLGSGEVAKRAKEPI